MNYLKDKIQASINTLYHDFDGPIDINSNDDRMHGDLATPVAFQIAKQVGENPKEIAIKIADKLTQELEPDIQVSVSENSPYINFTLSSQGYKKVYDLVQINDLPNVSAFAKGQRILLEFISANPTGPLTLANARGGFSGDALGRVLEFAGATKVEREYYYNDSGNQIMELGRSVVAARDGKEIEGGYKGEYIKELGRQITTDDPYTAGQQASQYIFNQWIKPMIDRMGITFDHFKSEQSLLNDGTLESVMNLLKQKGLIYEDEGAEWLKTTQFGDDKNRVMKRSDEGGNYTYLAKDIAYHWDKIQRGYNEIVTIVGADHFAEAKTLDLIIRNILKPSADWPGTFRQPIIQFVRLVAHGQEVKMSKRAGTFVTVDDLLDQVNPDVARFFFLMRDLNSPMDFDLDLAKESSDKNPVYYVQYAYVRAKHILEREGNLPLTLMDSALDKDEWHLLRLLHHDFANTIADIVATYEIHKLAHYAIELAKQFHSFYAKYPVLQAEANERANRLILTKLTFDRLRTVLHLMGISQPERMVTTAPEV